MKRCPACSRVYDDDALRFCLDDGTNLVERSPAEPAPATLVLPSTPEPVATMKQEVPPVVAPPVNNVGYQAAAAVPKKRSVLRWVVGVVVLVLFGAGFVVGALVIYKKRMPLKSHLLLQVDPSAPDREAAVRQTVDVIERRLDAYGVPNYRVTPQGNGEIMVDLPGVADPERLKMLIAASGKLELTHVISPPNPAPFQSYASKEEATASLGSNGTIPANRRVLLYTERDELAGPSLPSKKWVVVEAPAIVTGGDLRNASATKSTYSDDYQIMFSLNANGAMKFGNWTASNINEYLGVVLNDEVKSIAFIKSQISDSGMIEGRFSKARAEDLTLVLKSGALPAKILFLEERVDK